MKYGEDDSNPTGTERTDVPVENLRQIQQQAPVTEKPPTIGKRRTSHSKSSRKRRKSEKYKFIGSMLNLFATIEIGFGTGLLIPVFLNPTAIALVFGIAFLVVGIATALVSSWLTCLS